MKFARQILVYTTYQISYKSAHQLWKLSGQTRCPYCAFTLFLQGSHKIRYNEVERVVVSDRTPLPQCPYCFALFVMLRIVCFTLCHLQVNPFSIVSIFKHFPRIVAVPTTPLSAPTSCNFQLGSTNNAVTYCVLLPAV
jgi:hypothetical protein